VIESVLAGIAGLLAAAIRRVRSESPRPSSITRAALLVLFVPLFGVWMAFRAILLALRRTVDLEAEVDLGGGCPRRMRCTIPDMIQMYLALFGTWEPDLTAHIRRRLRPGDGYIDIGANVGAFVLVALEEVGREGSVLAIDASPVLATRLRENLARNGFVELEPGSPRVVQMAVSDVTGHLTLYEGPLENRGRSTTLGPQGAETTSYAVACAPLPRLATPEELRHARLIKIDVEGAEPAVLRGMEPAIAELRADCEILVELSPHWWPADGPTAEAVLAPYLRAGFIVYELPNNYWPWRYVWRRAIAPPKRFRESLKHLRRRVDLVLSRIDAEFLDDAVPFPTPR